MKTATLIYLTLFSLIGICGYAQDPNTVYGTDTDTPYPLYNPTYPNERINNSYFGYQIGFFYANRGSDNAALGFQAFYQPKIAFRNSSFGAFSGYGNQVGNDNVLLGAYSGFTNFSGNSNVNIGSYSGYTSYDNNYNVFVGGESGRYNVASENTFIGFSSGKVNTTGTWNAYLGYKSGFSNTLGKGNTFLGYESGLNNVGTSGSSGHYNTFVGKSAGAANTTGSSNVFLGSDSGAYSNASYNVFLGHYAGLSATGNANIYIGHGAGMDNTTGGSNVFIGHTAGQNITGSANVFIGSGCNVPTGSVSNKLMIETNPTVMTPNPPTPLIYGDFYSRKIGIGLPNTFSASDGFPVTSGGSPAINVSNYKLFVDGGVLSPAFTAAPFSGWADYVFDEDYKLNTLEEVEQFINENGHLPNIPSAKEVAENGIELRQMATLQQEKIEELTLYLIQQNKELQILKEQNREMQEKMNSLLPKK